MILFSQIVGDADLIEVFQKLHDEIMQNFMVDDFGIPSIGIWSLNLDLVPRHNDYLEVCMSWAVFACWIMRKLVVPLGWYPSSLTQQGALYKGKYSLYKVYMGLIIKGTIPRVPPFSL